MMETSARFRGDIFQLDRALSQGESKRLDNKVDHSRDALVESYSYRLLVILSTSIIFMNSSDVAVFITGLGIMITYCMDVIGNRYGTLFMWITTMLTSGLTIALTYQPSYEEYFLSFFFCLVSVLFIIFLALWGVLLSRWLIQEEPAIYAKVEKFVMVGIPVLSGCIFLWKFCDEYGYANSSYGSIIIFSSLLWLTKPSLSGSETRTEKVGIHLFILSVIMCVAPIIFYSIYQTYYVEDERELRFSYFGSFIPEQSYWSEFSLLVVLPPTLLSYMSIFTRKKFLEKFHFPSWIPKYANIVRTVGLLLIAEMCKNLFVFQDQYNFSVSASFYLAIIGFLLLQPNPFTTFSFDRISRIERTGILGSPLCARIPRHRVLIGATLGIISCHCFGFSIHFGWPNQIAIDAAVVSFVTFLANGLFLFYFGAVGLVAVIAILELKNHFWFLGIKLVLKLNLPIFENMDFHRPIGICGFSIIVLILGVIILLLPGAIVTHKSPYWLGILLSVHAIGTGFSGLIYIENEELGGSFPLIGAAYFGPISLIMIAFLSKIVCTIPILPLFRWISVGIYGGILLSCLGTQIMPYELYLGTTLLPTVFLTLAYTAPFILHPSFDTSKPKNMSRKDGFCYISFALIATLFGGKSFLRIFELWQYFEIFIRICMAFAIYAYYFFSHFFPGAIRERRICAAMLVLSTVLFVCQPVLGSSFPIKFWAILGCMTPLILALGGVLKPLENLPARLFMAIMMGGNAGLLFSRATFAAPPFSLDILFSANFAMIVFILGGCIRGLDNGYRASMGFKVITVLSLIVGFTVRTIIFSDANVQASASLFWFMYTSLSLGIRIVSIKSSKLKQNRPHWIKTGWINSTSVCHYAAIGNYSLFLSFVFGIVTLKSILQTEIYRAISFTLSAAILLLLQNDGIFFCNLEGSRSLVPALGGSYLALSFQFLGSYARSNSSLSTFSWGLILMFMSMPSHVIFMHFLWYKGMKRHNFSRVYWVLPLNVLPVCTSMTVSVFLLGIMGLVYSTIQLKMMRDLTRAGMRVV